MIKKIFYFSMLFILLAACRRGASGVPQLTLGTIDEVIAAMTLEEKAGLLVGYRYFSTFKVPVSFPFGFGLSYTSFAYSAPEVKAGKKGQFTASVTVTNSGKVPGKEVVELYVSASESSMEKPVRELKGFAKTRILSPGESEVISISFKAEDLASFSEERNAWVTDKGIYKVQFAASADDIRQQADLKLKKEIVRNVLTKL